MKYLQTIVTFKLGEAVNRFSSFVGSGITGTGSHYTS